VRTVAAFKEEAHFHRTHAVQTVSGGEVLEWAWAPHEDADLEAAI